MRSADSRELSHLRLRAVEKGRDRVERGLSSGSEGSAAPAREKRGCIPAEEMEAGGRSPLPGMVDGRRRAGEVRRGDWELIVQRTRAVGRGWGKRDAR